MSETPRLSRRGQVTTVDNSYRNVVGCCHECNSLNAGTAAADFLRILFRRGQLSSSDLETRLEVLSALTRGELKPDLSCGDIQ
ncbi:MAG: hypothetical protein IT449_09445 [Phycisphaerales bacterium]|nr:hypothetical protein [Phycisphaerales bacterium]